MTRFSRTTILEIVEALEFRTHAEIDGFLFRFEMEGADQSGGIEPRKMGIKRFLVDHPDRLGPSGSNLVLEILDYLFSETQTPSALHISRKPEERFPRLIHSLKRDGFVVEGDTLRRILPEFVPVAEAENEVNSLLSKFSFGTAQGHLSQAVSAHTRGEWASANGQLRSFIESLFDSVAETLTSDLADLPSTSHSRKEFLVKIVPPFLLIDLNEWELNGKAGFVQGFWKRLQPEGPHPGLSDEEDSTFRLHLVMVVASHYLRRLNLRLNPRDTIV